jgi:hypothetical protein
VLASDPREGLYWIDQERATYLNQLENAEYGPRPLGKVGGIAYNANKKMLAIYADPDNNGNIFVVDSASLTYFKVQETY